MPDTVEKVPVALPDDTVVENERTYFETIYSVFLTKVTDEMYAETWTENDLIRDLENLLIAAIPRFRFPKFKIFDFKKSVVNEEGEIVEQGYFNAVLTYEEISILSNLMVVEWLTRQIMTTENTRQKVYSSSDFKVSSQANHLDKLRKLKESYITECKTEQFMYGRRRISKEGYVKTTMSKLVGVDFDD